MREQQQNSEIIFGCEYKLIYWSQKISAAFATFEVGNALGIVPGNGK
jgi:hypothetical protein